LSHSSPKESGVQPVGKTRFIIGGAVFVGGFLSPLLIPLVTSSDLPGNWKAILSTGLVAGLPEVGMLLAVAILGKQGFAQLKETLQDWPVHVFHTAPAWLGPALRSAFL